MLLCDSSAQPHTSRRRRCGGTANEVVELSIDGPQDPPWTLQPAHHKTRGSNTRVELPATATRTLRGLELLESIRLGHASISSVQCPSDQPATIAAGCYITQRCRGLEIRSASKASAKMVYSTYGLHHDAWPTDCLELGRGLSLLCNVSIGCARCCTRTGYSWAPSQSSSETFSSLQVMLMRDRE